MLSVESDHDDDDSTNESLSGKIRYAPLVYSLHSLTLFSAKSSESKTAKAQTQIAFRYKLWLQ